MVDYESDILGVGTGQGGQEINAQIKIVTLGAGGAGNNTINRLLKVGVKGTELVAVNTDVQHFKIIDDRIKKILIGKTITKGLGAGGTRRSARRPRRSTGTSWRRSFPGRSWCSCAREWEAGPERARFRSSRR